MTALRTLSLACACALLLTTISITTASANSTVIDGPGFKVEKKNGWFGRKSTVYQDAMGNTVERKTGFLGHESSRTKVLGSEVSQNGKNITVRGPNGQPMVTKKKTLFGGEQTHIDGNGIIESVKGLFQ